MREYISRPSSTASLTCFRTRPSCDWLSPRSSHKPNARARRVSTSVWRAPWHLQHVSDPGSDSCHADRQSPFSAERRALSSSVLTLAYASYRQSIETVGNVVPRAHVAVGVARRSSIFLRRLSGNHLVEKLADKAERIYLVVMSANRERHKFRDQIIQPRRAFRQI